ncbi:hypothetical protein ACT8ZR_09125 [Neobacillus sp. M.A.Huq-85]
MNIAQKILHQEMKHKFVLERLLKMGVRESQTGKLIHDCTYEELKYELVLASFREIDAEHSSNGWF